MVIFEYDCNVVVIQLQYYCSGMHYIKNTSVKHELAFVCGEEEEASKHPRSIADMVLVLISTMPQDHL